MKQDDSIDKPPTSWRKKIRWLGPGVLWMAAGAGGAGELLFPPRVGSLYGYAFLWALLMAIALKWLINREIGRLAVCTGRPLLDGYQRLGGPRNWAVWLILIPQFFVAIASIAGIAGAAATAFILFLPGDVRIWTAVTLITSALLLVSGSYKSIEKVATVFAILLGLTGITTALSVLPEADVFLPGLRPQIPEDVDYIEIIPWLSFLLAGAAGMTWYSYWIPAKGYGAAGTSDPDSSWEDEASVKRLKGWLREMTLDNTLGVMGGLLIVLAFLILGAELLGPKNLVPEENKVASVLGTLLESTWGKWGFRIMIGGVLLGFWNTAMTNQDGWARLFANGTSLVGPSAKPKWTEEKYLRPRIIWVILVAAPLLVYLIAGEPVGLLQAAGIIEAIHIPIIAALTLYINRTRLPKGLRPNGITVALNIAACLFFLGFAGLYLQQLLTSQN